MQQTSWLACVALAAAAGFVGCAEEVEDINRVQPHYVKKSDLDGQWYYRQTITDVPPEFGIAFSGIECGLEKIRFEVTEYHLIGYRVHEAIPGLDEDDTAQGADFKGDPVVAFPIVKHFDIIRDFNRQTGEQSNVLVEDSSLRPWYERDYLRVQWVSNGRGALGAAGIAGPVDCAGLVHVNFLDSAPGAGYVDYSRDHDPFDPRHFQMTKDFIMASQWANVTDGGYACWLDFGYSGSIYGSPCGSVDVTVRHAFSRIDPEEEAQFEPVNHLDSELLQSEAEPFTDQNGNGRFEAGEPFQDLNANGEYDGTERIQYVTVSVGPDRDVMVDVACTPEVLEALEPEVTAADCRDLQWHHDGRFGYFRSERIAYDRLVGAGHDANRIHLANHHQIWRRTRDEQGNAIPVQSRELRPVIYHLNANFPDDLKTTAVKLARDWNEAFMEAAVAATGRTRSAIEQQLRGDFDADRELAVFMKGDDGQAFGPEALFQLRDNTCSVPGIEQFLDWYPELQSVVDAATEGAPIQPGNLERVCSGLSFESRKRGLDRPFVWQQMGDVRFSFIWWVHDAQPGGPLGYGPSSPDPESGRIISGNAYVYGAAVDEYARRSADVVRAINGELCDSDANQTDCLIEGRSYLDWLGRGGADTAREVAEINPDFQKAVSSRLGTPDALGRPFMTDKGLDKAAMRRNMADRMRRPQAADPMKWAAEAPSDEGKKRLEALMQDPDFRARMVSEPMLQAVAPRFGWTPGQPIPDAMYDLALKLSLDRSALRDRREAQIAFLETRSVTLPEAFDDSVVGQAMSLKGVDPEEVYQTLRKEIFEAVMLHEVGHTVGLRHNFKASFDALNYPDEFWQIRERFSPDVWDEERLPEYRYSSIMDYGARFNSDNKGLGRYDYAAIKYVYGGQVEVFDDKVPVPGRLDIELEYEDYSKIPDLLGGDAANITRRENRPVAELMAEKREIVRRNAELLVQNRDRNPAEFKTDRTVPYHYCSDELRGDLKCRTWDEGANHTEAVRSAIQRFWNYFLFTSYRTGRDENAFIQGFFARQDRLAEYLNYPWKYYRFFDAYPVDARDDLLRAAALGLNFVSEVIGAPEPGRHCFYEQLNAYLPAYFFNFDFQEACPAIDIGLGEGRDTWLDFNDEYLYKVDYLGTYYDKINLLYELLNTDTSFFRVTDETDTQAFTIGFYPVFRDEIVDLLRDMMISSLFYFRQDNSFQRLVTRGGDVRTQLLVDPRRLGLDRNTYPGTPRVFTQIPYNLIWQALALSAIFNTTSHDRQIDFVEYISISEVGSGDDREVGNDTAKVRFTHPHTGQVYEATRTDDGRSISAELLALAQNYVNTTWRDAKAAAEAPGAGADVRADFQQAEEQLQQFVELMDDLRQLKSWVDVGQ